MQRLLEQCLYHKEHLDLLPISAEKPSQSHYIDLKVLQSYVDRGRARLIDTAEFTSVAIKEGSQDDVQGLPCGARSLLIEKDSGKIIARGVNKFFDLQAVEQKWINDTTIWSKCVVSVQRKLAGFVVTMFSIDGRTLVCMSKHAVQGTHTDLSQKLLNDAFSSEQQRHLAERLFQLEASATFECVDTASDFYHPVLEHSTFDKQLTLLSIQKRSTLAEITLCFSETEKFAAETGLRCVPAVLLTSAAALEDAIGSVTSWHALYPALECSILAEGIIVLIEFPLERVIDRHQLWVIPVRLKVKTTKYIVLRSLRSLIRGDSEPRFFLYHLAIMSWARLNSIDLREMEHREGISMVNSRFEQSISLKYKVHHRDSELSVGTAFGRILQVTELEAQSQRHPMPLSVALFCGLPGAGKTTLCQNVIERLKLHPSVFSYTVYLSRDDVTQFVQEKHQINRESARHKQRCLQGLIHRELLSRIELLKQYCIYSGRDRHGLLLFDACNSTPNTRCAWRRCFPSSLDGMFLVSVECKDQDILVKRLANRTEHRILVNREEAQRAFYTVKKKFSPPTLVEDIGLVIHCDTTANSAAFLADSLAQTLSERVQTSTPSTTAHVLHEEKRGTQLIDFDKLAASVESEKHTLLHSLVGCTGTDSSKLSLLTYFGRCQLWTNAFQKKVLIALKLDVSADDLGSMVASVLISVLDLHSCMQGNLRNKAASTPSPWWRRFLRKIGITQNKMNHSTALHATVEAGQVKWIKGWLLQGRVLGKGKTDLSQTLNHALRQRFENKPSFFHITLLHSSNDRSEVSDFWKRSGFLLGQQLSVQLKELLMDRFAICFTAMLPDGQTSQWSSGGLETPSLVDYLHLTVGTAAGVSAKYSGVMLRHFKEWQKANDELELYRAKNCAKRSRQKYHNFVKLKLSTPLVYSGTLVQVCE